MDFVFFEAGKACGPQVPRGFEHITTVDKAERELEALHERQQELWRDLDFGKMQLKSRRAKRKARLLRRTRERLEVLDKYRRALYSHMLFGTFGSKQVANRLFEQLPEMMPYPSWVYFVRSTRFVKIGVAINPNSRLTSIQTGNAHPCRIVGLVPGDRSIEQRFHKEFEHLHRHGEWFWWRNEVGERLEECCALRRLLRDAGAAQIKAMRRQKIQRKRFSLYEADR